LEEKETIMEFRVILKKETPPTDIKNAKGKLIFQLQERKLLFLPKDENQNNSRIYAMEDFANASIVTFKELFRKKEIILIKFSKKQVRVDVYFEPIDVSVDYLLQRIQEYRDRISKATSLSSAVGSFFEKLGSGSQKIVQEIGSIIQSSHELSQAISQSIAFIREATKAANILNSVEITQDDGKTINLKGEEIDIDVDEILKRSLASDKIEAMISGLIAKGLISARDQKFQEALDAFKIAREAAEKENLTEYTHAVDENIENLKRMESADEFNTELSEKAIKYATEARDYNDKKRN
jgi:hypothetical protein